MKPILFLFAGAYLFLASCDKKSKTTNDALKQVIIEKYKNIRSTLKSGDPDYVVSMHTKDAVQFLANGTEIAGITALKAFYEKVAAMGIDIKSTPTTIELLTNDTAFEVGTFLSTSKTGQQNAAKYIIIWKKVDGDWKIYKAIDQAKL